MVGEKSTAFSRIRRRTGEIGKYPMHGFLMGGLPGAGHGGPSNAGVVSHQRDERDSE
jgi:hypothetical protein